MDIPKKVFVSYKYSDVVHGRENTFNFRDDLIKRLGGLGLVHKGESEESYDLSNLSRDQIINKIAPYVKKSSITVVLITPNAIKSQWIPWEVSLSLRIREYKQEQNMTRNGIIGVYLPLNINKLPDKNGNYDYYFHKENCGTTVHHTKLLPKIIQDNIFNLIDGSYTCSSGCCKDVYSSAEGSYIELVNWHSFVANIDKYIERAWARRNNFEKYDIRIKLERGE